MESVLNAALLMQKRNFRHIPVTTDSNRIVGLISAQDIIDSLALVVARENPFTESVVESLRIPVQRVMKLHCIVVEPGDGFSEVVKKLVNHDIGATPVVDELGRVQGIVTLRDLVSLMGISSEPIGVRVSELMTTNAITIDREARISEAIRLMSERRIRRLPIVGLNGEFLGMLTNKDILKHLARLVEKNPEGAEFDLRVREFMTREVITISQDDDARTAASSMMIFGVGGLGVEDYTPSVAVITERDLIRRLTNKRSLDFFRETVQFEIEAESRTRH
jgi:CBS domain-containing protein